MNRSPSPIPLSMPCRIFAAIFDLGFSWAFFFALYFVFQIFPVPGLALGLGFVGFVALVWSAQKLLWRVTLGERLWLKAQQSGLIQSLGSFLTVSSLVLGGLLTYASIVFHPMGTQALRAEWSAFFPNEAANAWTVLPFYYTLGAWPKSFHGKSVFYSLPYEKGPPERFAGQIISKWDTPEVRVTIEGPKSPLRSDKYPYDRDEIQACLLERSLHCLSVRAAVLERHLEALNSIRPSKRSLSWVRVSNRALEPSQQLQGIYLSGQNKTRGEDRFILITPKGTHQTFVLDYPVNDEGTLARETFQNVLRSLRVSDDLGPGRAWVDQSLAKVDLRNIDKLGLSDAAIQGLAETQSLLIARISVDPKNFDTYFHLAGTALMLGRYAVKLRQLPPPQGNPEHATELLSVVKPLVQNAERYAQDVNPRDPRIKLLQGFQAETQKF